VDAEAEDSSAAAEGEPNDMLNLITDTPESQNGSNQHE